MKVGAGKYTYEVAPTHGMGIDAAGNIYVGLTQMGHIKKYVRVH